MAQPPAPPPPPSTRASPQSLLATAKAFFDARGWRYDEAGEAPVLRLGFDGEHGRWMCFVEAKETLGQLVFFSVWPEPVPLEQRDAVAEYLMRVNCGLNVGNLELNFDDGMVRCRTGLDVEGQGLSEPLLHNLTLLNVATLDKYLPGLQAVLGGAAPAEAHAQVVASLDPS